MNWRMEMNYELELYKLIMTPEEDDPDISYKEWLKSHTKYKKNVME